MYRMVRVLHEISIDEALLLRDSHSESRFICPECRKPVILYAAGPGSPAHAQHETGNEACSLSDYSDAATKV